MAQSDAIRNDGSRLTAAAIVDGDEPILRIDARRSKGNLLPPADGATPVDPPAMASPPAAPSGHPREGGLLGALRSGAWLRPGRVRAYCRIFLLMDVLAVILLAATASGPL